MTFKFRNRNMVILLVLLIFISYIGAACKGGSIQPFEGKLILYYANIYNSSEFETGIYEFKYGQSEPQLILSDMPFRISGPDYSYKFSPAPTVSRNGELIYFPGYGSGYLLNVKSDKGYIIPNLVPEERDYGEYVSFSPENSFIAQAGTELSVTPLEDNAWGPIHEFCIDALNLETAYAEGAISFDEYWDGTYACEQAQSIFYGNTFVPLYGECEGYFGCDEAVCLTVEHPIWVDDMTLIVFHDSRIIDGYEFPDTIGSCSVVSYSDMYSVFSLDGTLINRVNFNNDSFDFFEIIPTYANQANNGSILITYRHADDVLQWWNTNELVEGKLNPHDLPSTDPFLFYLSPAGTTMFRMYNEKWEFLDLVTNQSTVLDSKKALLNIDELLSCAWSPNGEDVACIGNIPANFEEYKLFIASRTNLNVQELLHLDDKNSHKNGYGWHLIGWLP